MKKKLIILYTLILLSASACPQSGDILKIRAYRAGHEKDILNEFILFLSIPNVAADTVSLHKNAAFIMNMMKMRGMQQVQLLFPVSAGAPPSVYGEILAPGAKKDIDLLCPL